MSSTETLNDKDTLLNGIHAFFNLVERPLNDALFVDTLETVSRKRIGTLEKLVVTAEAASLISKISEAFKDDASVLMELFTAVQTNENFRGFDRKETLAYTVAVFSMVMNSFVIQRVMENADRNRNWNTMLSNMNSSSKYVMYRIFNQIYQYVAENNIERSTTRSHLSGALRQESAAIFYIKNDVLLSTLDFIKGGNANANTLGYVECVCPIMRKPEESITHIHDGINHPIIPTSTVDHEIVEVLDTFAPDLYVVDDDYNNARENIVLENPSVNHVTALPEMSKVDYDSLGDIHLPFNRLRDDSILHTENREISAFKRSFDYLMEANNSQHYNENDEVVSTRQTHVGILQRKIDFHTDGIVIANANNFMDRFDSGFRSRYPEIIENITSSTSFTNWVAYNENGTKIAKTYNGIVFTGMSRGSEMLRLKFRGFRPIVDTVSQERRNDAQERHFYLMNHIEDVSVLAHDVDTNLESNVLWNIPFKKVRDALRLNKVVMLNAKVDYYATGGPNEDGYDIPPGQNGSRPQVTGQFAFRRNADASYDVLTTELNLRCSCYVYQNSQNCRHLLPTHRGYIRAITRGIRLDSTKTVDIFNNLSNNAIDVDLEKSMKKFFLLTKRYDSTFSYGVKISEDNSTFTYMYVAKPNQDQNDYPLASSYMRPYGLIPGFNDPSYVLDADSLTTYMNELSLLSDLVQQSSRVGTFNMFLPYLQYGEMNINATYNYAFMDANSDTHKVKFMLKTIALDDSTLNNIQTTIDNVVCSCMNTHCAYVAFTIKNPTLGILLTQEQAAQFMEGSSNVEKMGISLATLVKEGFTEQLVALNASNKFDARDINEMASYATLLSAVRHISDVSALPDNIYQAALIQSTINENNGENRYGNGVAEMYRNKSEMLQSEFSLRSVNNNRRQRRMQTNSVSFTHNIETYNREEFFDIAYRAKHDFEAGTNPLPYINSNVIHTPEEINTPITFGVEIEYDFPEDWSEGRMANTNETIATTLYQLGYIPNPYREGYHSGLRNGYTSWSFERDSSVNGGELVSPILSDTPEAWAQIKKVCEVLTTNGAIASPRTGLHVHVGTEHYGNSTAKYAELVRTLNTTQETIYRLAKNPNAENHRGYNYCAPNTYDIEGNIGPNVTRHIRGNSGHSLGLNLAEVNFDNPSRSHVEFRMWDATLIPQVIQQQVKLSIALVLNATHKVTMNNGHSYPLNMLPKTLGSNHIIHQGKDQWHNIDTFMEVNEDAYALINEIFPRPEDRESITQLLAINNWVQ